MVETGPSYIPKEDRLEAPEKGLEELQSSTKADNQAIEANAGFVADSRQQVEGYMQNTSLPERAEDIEEAADIQKELMQIVAVNQQNLEQAKNRGELSKQELTDRQAEIEVRKLDLETVQTHRQEFMAVKRHELLSVAGRKGATERKITDIKRRLDSPNSQVQTIDLRSHDKEGNPIQFHTLAEELQAKLQELQAKKAEINQALQAKQAEWSEVKSGQHPELISIESAQELLQGNLEALQHDRATERAQTLKTEFVGQASTTERQTLVQQVDTLHTAQKEAQKKSWRERLDTFLKDQVYSRLEQAANTRRLFGNRKAKTAFASLGLLLTTISTSGEKPINQQPVAPPPSPDLSQPAPTSQPNAESPQMPAHLQGQYEFKQTPGWQDPNIPVDSASPVLETQASPSFANEDPNIPADSGTTEGVASAPNPTPREPEVKTSAPTKQTEKVVSGVEGDPVIRESMDYEGRFFDLPREQKEKILLAKARQIGAPVEWANKLLDDQEDLETLQMLIDRNVFQQQQAKKFGQPDWKLSDGSQDKLGAALKDAISMRHPESGYWPPTAERRS